LSSNVAPFVGTRTYVEQSHCWGPSTERVTFPIRKAMMSRFGTGQKIKDIWILAPSNYALSTCGIEERLGHILEHAQFEFSRVQFFLTSSFLNLTPIFERAHK
jgi:hypothetical protein